MNREVGQATVELIAAIPAIVLAGAVTLQLLLAGYALTLADGAAEAGSLALVAGQPAREAARESLPGWAADGAEISVSGGEVTVRLSSPSLLPMVGRAFAVTSSSYARPFGR